jgi:hypothetical protein
MVRLFRWLVVLAGVAIRLLYLVLRQVMAWLGAGCTPQHANGYPPGAQRSPRVISVRALA